MLFEKSKIEYEITSLLNYKQFRQTEKTKTQVLAKTKEIITDKNKAKEEE